MQHSGSKGAVFAVAGEVACFFLMILYYFCLSFSASVSLFVFASSSGLLQAQMKVFYLESVIIVLNGIICTYSILQRKVWIREVLELIYSSYEELTFHSQKSNSIPK